MAFEKISLNQWLTYNHGNINNYNNIMIPKRSTINAAGYDFFIPFKLEMVPGKVYKIGDKIRVRVVSTDIVLRHINFELEDYHRDITETKEEMISAREYRKEKRNSYQHYSKNQSKSHKFSKKRR